MSSRWDFHKHRGECQVSDWMTIYHPSRGQLCQVERHWDVLLFHPIAFSSKESAWKWIKEGCIAELQEGLGNLAVGFSRHAMRQRKSPMEEMLAREKKRVDKRARSGI